MLIKIYFIAKATPVLIFIFFLKNCLTFRDVSFIEIFSKCITFCCCFLKFCQFLQSAGRLRAEEQCPLTLSEFFVPTKFIKRMHFAFIVYSVFMLKVIHQYVVDFSIIYFRHSIEFSFILYHYFPIFFFLINSSIIIFIVVWNLN
jgi:hypothetical protein